MGAILQGAVWDEEIPTYLEYAENRCNLCDSLFQINGHHASSTMIVLDQRMGDLIGQAI